MFKKKELISVFDIEGDLIKLAQISLEDNRRFLYRLTTKKAPEDSLDGLTKAIRKLAGDYKIAGGRVIVNLPRYKVTVKNLKLPSISPSEIESMVSLQAAKQLPFLPEKIVSGYKILARDEKGYSDVMAVMAQRDIVDNILKPFNQAGLDVEKLALSSEALSLWYIQRQKEDEKKTSISVVDIGKSVLEIQIIREGKLDFSRSVSFSSPGDMEKRMVDEIRMTIFTYQKTWPDFLVTKLVLTGKRSVINSQAPILKKDIGLTTVYIDVLKTWPKKDDTALPTEEELSNQTFTALLSLGFNYDKVETNIMPQEIRQRRVTKFVKESLMMSSALFLSIILGIGGIATKNFIDKKRFLASIDKRLNEAKPKVERLSRLKDITELVKRNLDITSSSIDIIRELYSKIPPEISLTIFDYEDGSLCLLRGTSQGLSDVFKFISTLEESLYFKNVKVRYATKRAIGKKELTDFEIICELSQISLEGLRTK